MENDYASHIVVLSAPSGTGKDTIAARLIQRDSRLELSCSATTRKKRGSEQEGVDYYFMSTEEFDGLVQKGGFIEFAQYGRNKYGTLKSDVMHRIDAGKTVILVIDIQGGASIRKMYPGALTVFILPPSAAELERRLRNRGTDSDEEISERIRIAENEMKCASEYDYTVINDDLDKAVGEVYNIIAKHCLNGG
ncbi:MAG: guanylate kinase [Clostridia bacterium]|nr:guanylate kinase [Clostridia bacterium]